MENIEIISIPAIVAIVCTVMQMLKKTIANDKFNRFIPLISCLLGAICGVVAFYCVPGVFETQNLLVAIVLGAASGLSATGTNQIAKQLTKPTATEEVIDNESA